MSKPLLFFIIALIALIGFLFLKPSNNPHKREQILTDSIRGLKSRITALEKTNLILEDSVKKSRDTVIVAAKEVTKAKLPYNEARKETDLKPDSANQHKELMAARELIEAQDGHIVALTDLTNKLDAVIANQKQIIATQAEAIGKLDSLVEVKDDQVKEERKRGNRKFFKGAALGALVTVVLVLI